MEEPNDDNHQVPLLGSAQITYSKDSIPFKWVIVIGVSVLLLAIATSTCFLLDGWEKTSVSEKIGIVVAFIPVIFFQLAFAIPVLVGHLRSWWFRMPFQPWKLFVPSAIIAVSYTIGSICTLRFDPLGSSLLFILSLVVFANMQQDHVVLSRDFTWVDAGIWIMLWMPMDIGFRGVWRNLGSVDQWWWSTAISVILLISWGLVRSNIDLGYSIIIKWKTLIVFVILLAIIGGLSLPFIFLTNFVHWAPPQGGWVTFVLFQKIIGVAIPQELFYRSVLVNGLLKATSNRIVAVAISSILYGLTFWSNDFPILTQLCYFAFGIVTGALYGISFLISGSVLPSILVHSLLDFFISGFTIIQMKF